MGISAANDKADLGVASALHYSSPCQDYPFGSTAGLRVCGSCAASHKDAIIVRGLVRLPNLFQEAPTLRMKIGSIMNGYDLR